MPASKPTDIRNLVLLGHGGAGKTSLADAILHVKKIANRLGSVNDGTSLLDFTDIEKEGKHSVDPAILHVEHKGKTMNIVDAPGAPGFIGGAIGGMNGVDVAVVVISAPAGIEVNARRLFKIATEAGMPRALIVNKIDAENIQYDQLMSDLTETFGEACKPINLPSGEGSGVVDCLTGESGETDFGDVESAKMEITESIVEADEELMEAYLGGDEPSAQQVATACVKAMIEGTVIPVFFMSATGEVGVTEFLDRVAECFPDPTQVATRPARGGEQEDAEEIEISVDLDKPFIAQAFKITTDPFVGKQAWVRVLQGTAKSDTHYHLADDKKSTKIGHLFKVRGKESEEVPSAVAGDIVALAKVEEITTGAVLHEAAAPMYRAMLPTPTPMFSLAVQPKSRGDEQKISTALSKLTDEDPTFKAGRDAQTGETVISGIGDMHLRVILAKMKERFDLEVETKPPKIPYLETITVKAEGHHRHKKQTGGAGQFGEVYLRVEPLERGAGFEFVNDLFGESIPRQFLPAIEKGVREVLGNGAIAGHPMKDIRVSVYDGKHHPVDSKEIAFKTAGKFAFIDAVKKAKPALLEPLVSMEITCPSANMGDIASDLSGRRGRILGQEMLPGNQMVVSAVAPLAEVMQYNSNLRSITGGQGSYSMELSHYEPVPGNVQQQIIAAGEQAKQEEG